MLWYDELANNQRGFSPLNVIAPTQPLAAWIKGNTLDAQDDSYYLLEMIKASRHASKDENHGNKLRHLLNFAYQAIDHFTSKIAQQ